MRPLSENTELIIEYYKQGKKASEIRDLLPLQPNGKKMTIQGVSNAINRYLEREQNGNGKPKEPIVKKDIIETLTSGKPLKQSSTTFQNELRNEWEKPKETLDSLDYNTIGDICNRVINQLRGKIPEEWENSTTTNIVVKAYFLKKKLVRLGLIQEITDEIIKEIKEVD